ncbi:MAG TPA: hypothetical protein VFT12_06005 [Thermoanaerobaculia bacterium]|nr:hypothetical protein [Thermoanaerobaculia bacterium]
MSGAAMDWSEYEFVLPDQPQERRAATSDLTGWETVVFELEDEERDGD